MRKVLHLCGLPPKAHNPSLIMRENLRQIQVEGQCTRRPDKSASKLSRSSNQGKSEKLSHRKLRGMTTKCNVHPGTEKAIREKISGIQIKCGIKLIIMY